MLCVCKTAQRMHTAQPFFTAAPARTHPPGGRFRSVLRALFCAKRRTQSVRRFRGPASVPLPGDRKSVSRLCRASGFTTPGRTCANTCALSCSGNARPSPPAQDTKLPAESEDAAGKRSARYRFLPQHFLNFLPLPQGQGSFLPTFTPLYMCCSSFAAEAPPSPRAAGSVLWRRFSTGSAFCGAGAFSGSGAGACASS